MLAQGVCWFLQPTFDWAGCGFQFMGQATQLNVASAALLDLSQLGVSWAAATCQRVWPDALGKGAVNVPCRDCRGGRAGGRL